MYKDFTTNGNKGNVLIIVMVLFVAISLSVALGLVTPVIRASHSAQNALESKRSYFIAESGVEDVLYRLRSSMSVSSSETLVLGTQETTTTLTDIQNGQKQIESLGDSQNRNRSVTVTVQQGAGVSFNYGLQVGRGGIDLAGSSGINGNVYANGNIHGTSSSFITGSAIAASSDALTTDQSNGTGTPTSGITFGNATATQSVAQSFVVSEEIPLNKLQLYLLKTGSPSNITVSIAADAGGVPSTTTLATGSISASLVTTAYGWVDATFTSSPTLQTGTTYWIVLTAGTSATANYTIGTNTNGYIDGTSKIGRHSTSVWSAPTPATLDTYFKLYLGGLTSSIYGDSQYNQLHIGTSGAGIAKAHTVNYTNATGSIYCQTGTLNNKACNTTQADPTPEPWPVSDGNIDTWKAEAVAGGTLSGNQTYGGTTNTTLGPKKIAGNLSIGGSAVVSVTGTLWVTGNLTVDGSGALKLASAYGSGSGTIIVDGRVIIAGSSPVTGSGTTGSYIMILSLSDCPTSSSCSGSNAIDISGAAGAVILVAQNGTINFSGSASAKQATGYTIKLSGATTVTYESGIANLNFTSGASGSWVVQSWKETE